MKTILHIGFIVIGLLAGAGLGACNTVDGIGQDLEGAGRSIQKTF